MGSTSAPVTQASLRRQFGLAPQDAFLFSGTVADNIRFSRPDASDDRGRGGGAAGQRARRSSCACLPVTRPKCWEGGVNLSAGERQLISIARAGLAEPRILILDEATSSVDTVTELLIQDALERLLRAAPRWSSRTGSSTIRKADLICVVDAGQIVERGTHDGAYQPGRVVQQAV